MAARYAKISGWGHYVPSRVVTNKDLAKTLDTSDEAIYALSGIRERRLVSPGESTSHMAIAASQEALEKARVDARDLGLIIVATSSPDYLTPSVASQVQHALGAKGVPAFGLSAGCAGFVYALATAQQFIVCGSYDNVLVVGAEVIGRFMDWTDRSTCILFGDGAGAAVLQVSDKPGGVLGYALASDGSAADHIIMPAGGAAAPSTHETVDKGLHYVQMKGSQVMTFSNRVLGKAMLQALQQAGIKAKDLDLFVPHQANVRIIRRMARQLGIPKEKVFVNIDRFGNTSTASIPIAVSEAIEQGRAKVGDKLGFTALGAGLAWGAAVIEVGEPDQPIAVQRARLARPAWLSLDPFRAVARTTSANVIKPLLVAGAVLGAWFRRMAKRKRDSDG
ncbi:MAG: beta-ketoacyl-ACP synthase III [Anaerolineales bacterium]|jgi:3-oxoacyl-[acyl-carrier-protein] synthase-3